MKDLMKIKDELLGIDFEDKIIIYGMLLLFAWLCNTGIVMQLQLKQNTKLSRVILYSVFIPGALFIILVPLLMYFKIWANYPALVVVIIASNFFIYFQTKNLIMKKNRLVNFSTKLDAVKKELLEIMDKEGSGGQPSKELAKFRKDLDDFGPKYYNGI